MQQSVQQNYFFVHRENLLLAMLGGEDKNVRAKADYIIEKIRYAVEGNQDGERDPVREFYLPRCNFAATLCTNLKILKTTAVGMVSPILPTKNDILCCKRLH